MSVENHLTPEQQIQAHELWVALMFAPSPEALLDAKQALKLASDEVRSAILKAQVDLWRQQKVPTAEDPNPFA